MLTGKYLRVVAVVFLPIRAFPMMRQVLQDEVVQSLLWHCVDRRCAPLALPSSRSLCPLGLRAALRVARRRIERPSISISLVRSQGLEVWVAR